MPVEETVTNVAIFCVTPPAVIVPPLVTVATVVEVSIVVVTVVVPVGRVVVPAPSPLGVTGGGVPLPPFAAGAAGVTLLEAAEATPVPMALVAVTVKV
jgi:hypothetical protein